MRGRPVTTLLLDLPNWGYDVLVLDWRHDVGDKLCTGIVGQECIRRFPVEPLFIHREAASAQVVPPRNGNLRFEAATPQARIINRVAYVASFADRARAAGAGYLLGQRVLRVIPGPREATVLTNEGRHEARALVLAAGFGSPLTRQLGLGSVSDYVAGVQVEACARGIKEVQVYVGHEVAPGFFAWLVPTLPDRALVGLLARRHAQEYLSRFIRRLKDEGKITALVNDPGTWGIPLRPLKRSYQDRALIVGDAAGQVKPTTGGGIFYSLLASEIAVSVLDEALVADDLSASKLSRYQKDWRGLLARELEIGYSARRLYEYLNDQQISSLVHQAGSNGIRADLVSSPDLSFDWHSRMITRVMGHPALGGALQLINPLLARLASRSDPDSGLPPFAASQPQTLANLPE